MFPNKIEHVDYDFLKAENYEKWKGTFSNSLGKVLEQWHPTLTAAEEALLYVEELILMLMGKLCARPCPHTLQDVDERVVRTVPEPVASWALNDAAHVTNRVNKKRKPMLPVDKIHQLLQKEVFMYKIDLVVTSFIVAVVESIAGNILNLAGNYVKKISTDGTYTDISSQDIKTSMNADKALMAMFYQEHGVPREKAAREARLAQPLEPSRTPRASLTYEELVRDLMSDEKHYLRDLHMIIRVFREELDKILPKDSKDVDKIFGNIVEIYELTVTLLGSLEDTVESASETQMPHIGICFEELAEAEEFDVYVTYAQTVTTQESREALQAIVDNPELSERLDTAGHGFRLAVKYYLPKLLASPITHAFLYMDYVSMLLKMAPYPEDMESFQQVEGLMRPIQESLLLALENGPKIEGASRMASRARRQVALEKTNELAKLIDNWDTKDIGQCCNEFIKEDTLGKVGPGRRVSERRAFLFDGLLLLCKPCPARQDLKPKERLYIRKMDIVDRPDTEELRNCLELSQRYGNSVVLCCNGAIDKNRWMADLVMLNTKSMLDRTLDSILQDLGKKHPLKLPPPSLYRFAVPDSAENIVLEDRQNSGVPLIKGATLLKLVERLTYHIYADPMFVRTFLTTYRSFCKPPELLDLLIERFNIPDPSLVYDAPEKVEAVVADTEKLSKNSSREDFKRYRKEYLQPVQFRVLNVLRHWVDQHYYDFERDSSLLEKLKAFLDGITGKPMKKWVESALKIIQRKSGGLEQLRPAGSASSPPAALGPGSSEGSVASSLTTMLHVVAPVVCVFDRTPPPLEWHYRRPEQRGWHILVLHPIEVARQLTLLEFDLYKMVKPSELVGAVWTKKDKETSSPNLLRIIKHANNFSRWIEKSIVEAENLEERVAILCRALEVMMVLLELNNFNGILAVVAALASAAVFRLRFTSQMLPARLYRVLMECHELTSDHFRKYQEKLRSINPPCVPFFGMYLTNILLIEEGNTDFLYNTELINFSKRRMVADITGEIQQYQNQPYCLTVEPRLRNFLENLNPFPGMEDAEIRDYLYKKSLEIEPRNARQAPRFPRKWPELSLKSPGIKPARTRHGPLSSSFVNSVSASDVSDDASTSQLSPTASMWDGQSVASFGSMASLQQDEELSPRPRGRPQNRHSSMSSSSTFGPESISPRLPSTSISELSSKLLDNFSNAPPPVSPRPLSTLPHSSNHQKTPLISPRLTNPAANVLNKGSNESGAMSLAREQTPPPPPRSFPSPDHQMVEFRNPNGPKWPNDSSFLNDSLPPRLPMSCEEKHHKIVSDIISNASGNFSSDTVPRIHKLPVLSPRNPIVDANLFYGTNNAGFHIFENTYKKQMKLNNGELNNVPELSELRINKPPAISPRNCPNMRVEDGSAPRNSFNIEVDRTTKPVLLTTSKTNGELSSISTSDSEDPPLIMPRSRAISQSAESGTKEPVFSGAASHNVISSSNATTAPSSNDEENPVTPPERPPALSPRSSAMIYGNSGMTKQLSLDGEDTPIAKTNHNQSPKDLFGNFGRFMETSPKLLPTQVNNELYNAPPLSPHVNVPNSVQNYERHHGVSVSGAAFSFPSLGTRPGVSPSWASSVVTPRPSPTMTQSLGPIPHTPPPLPPRRKRDSTPQLPQPSPTAIAQEVPCVPPRGGGSPPPLPPRSTQPPAPLLRPHHSAILQRRQHANTNSFPTVDASGTPQLPPKPPPSTVFLSPSVTHAAGDAPQ